MKKKLFMLLLCAIFTVQAVPQTMFQHPWQGKRVAYFGDSITDPKNKSSKLRYWEFLQQWLQITPYTYAISGRQWNDIPRQADQLLKDHGQDFDAIIILIGTNDFNAAVPIGKWFKESDEQVLAAVHGPKQIVTRKRRVPDMDDTTYRGRINIAMSKLKSMFPTKQIVLLTPLHRSYAFFHETNIQPDESYQNQCGEYIDRYVESVKEAGNIWAVPVIDINATSGLFPLLPEQHQFFHDEKIDQLHPNDAGHQRIARTLYYALLALPCTF
jgi:lysophospholipase L1-like esterase